jgi:hypothetical protein
MPAETKLDACGNRFIHQVKILKAYLDVVLIPLKEKKDKKIFQFSFESIILRLVSFIEEYLSCLIGMASCYEEKLILKYFTKYGSESKRNKVKKGCNLGELWRLAASEISFKDQAKKLKRIFNYIFGFSPFPDLKTENLILDMIRIRNVIVHSGSWPTKAHAMQMATPGVIVVSREIELEEGSEPARFCQIDLIDSKFIPDIMYAVGKMEKHIQNQLRKDPQFSFIKK